MVNTNMNSKDFLDIIIEKPDVNAALNKLLVKYSHEVQMGDTAWRNGTNLYENPFKSGTMEYDAWRHGWQERLYYHVLADIQNETQTTIDKDKLKQDRGDNWL